MKLEKLKFKIKTIQFKTQTQNLFLSSNKILV